jgi:hypothetical protein
MFNFLKKTAYTSIVLSAFALSAISGSAVTTTTTDSEPVSNLLADIKTEAVVLSSDAGRMASFSRLTGLDWRSHAEVITRIKEHINEAGRLHAKLQELRGTAAPWQQMAIDRSLPMLKELADNTTKAINFINAKPARLFQEEYKAYLEANADTASRLAAMVADFVDYGSAEGRREDLERKLEVPAKR